MEFQVGDYVTGINRTYKRSIYKICDLKDKNSFTLSFVCLEGRLGHYGETYTRDPSEFRIATDKEIHEELGHALIRLTKYLIYGG